MKPPKTFAIIGLGLLGGSLGGALKRAFPRARVLGVSRSPQKIRIAQKKKLITTGTTSLPLAVSAADFIFICTPVDTISHIILKVDQFAKKGATVTDVGSTKGDLILWAQKQRFKNIYFVGSHPMAGSHLTGIKHAKVDLYKSSFTFVTRHRGINQKAFELTKQIWRKVCKRVIEIDAQTHDEVTAEISHLPHLVATLLVDHVSPKALQYASSGFGDTTRVAQGDPRLWVPIFGSNRKNLIQGLQKLAVSIKKLSVCLKSQKKCQAYLYPYLKQAARKRSNINL